MIASMIARLLVVSSWLAAAFAMGSSEEMNFITDEITVLTMNHLREELHHFDAVAIMFIAPWCGHCKRSKEDWSAAKERSATYNSFLVKVDGTDRRSKEALINFKVTAYPTIVIVNKTTIHNNYYIHKGERTTDAIVSAVANVAGPAYSTSESDMRSGIPQVTGFLRDGSDASKIFKKTAQNLRGIASFSLVNTNEPTNCNISVRSVEHPERHVLKEFDGITTTKLVNFIRRTMHSLTSHRVVSSKREFRSLQLQPFSRMILLLEKGKSQSSKQELILSAVAEKWHPEGVIIVVSTVEYGFDNLHLSKHDNEIIGVVYYDHVSGDSFADSVSTDLTVGFLNIFIEESRSGLAPKLQKSVEKHLSPTSKQKGVIHLTGQNVKETVMLQDKTVILLIYTPWCYFSHLAADGYADVAKAFEGEDDMMVSSIDASVNDVPPEFGVFGFPTFIMYTKKRKSREILMPLFFYGNRSSASIAEFIVAHNVHMKADYSYLSGEVPKAGFDFFHTLSDIYIGLFLPIKIPLGGSFPTLRTDLATLIFVSFIGIPGSFYLLLLIIDKYCFPPKRRVRKLTKPALKAAPRPKNSTSTKDSAVKKKSE